MAEVKELALPAKDGITLNAEMVPLLGCERCGSPLDVGEYNLTPVCCGRRHSFARVAGGKVRVRVED